MSCTTVKEKRDACPCQLVFIPADDSFSFDREGMFILFAYDEDSAPIRLEKDRIAWRYLLEPSYDVPVKRGIHTISTIVDIGQCVVGSGKICMSDGYQSGRLSAENMAVDCRGDEAEVVVGDKRQSAAIHLRIRYLSEDEMFPYYIRVNGNYGALELKDLSPAPYDFSFIPECDVTEDNLYIFTILRQPSSDAGEILVELWSCEYECFVDRLRIDRYIRKAGYDWSAESLEDIFLDIDLARASVSVTVNGWEVTMPVEIEI